MADVSTSDRYERGLKKMSEVYGVDGGEFVEPLKDLGRYMVEFPYGDIYSRPGLAVRDHTRLAWQEELPHVRSQLEGQEGALAVAPPNSPGASDHMLVRRPL